MGLTIRYLKTCICEGRCGDMVFHELFTQGETVPDPGWPSGCVVSEIEDGPFYGDFRITHPSVQEYGIEGIPAEAVKVLSGDGFPAPRRNTRTDSWPRGFVLADVPTEIVRFLERDPTDFNRHLETLDRLWRSVVEGARAM
jgi:hypothetical protein